MRSESGKRHPAWMVALCVAFGAALAAIALTPTAPRALPSARAHAAEMEARGKATPIVTGTFHGDTRVNPETRRAVEDGFASLERVTCGLAKLEVSWDFDPARDTLKATMLGWNVVLAVTEAQAVFAYGKVEGGELLGLCQRAGALWIHLVVEKLDGDHDLTEWVVTHELSHALGMDHTSLGLMEPTAPLIVIGKPYWSPQDTAEFCRLYDCSPEMFANCPGR